MKKVLIAIDDVKGSKAVLAALFNLIQKPEEVILLHVVRLEGKSLMIDMLGEAELSTLRESLKGTEHRENLDRDAEKILGHYKKELQDNGLSNIKTLVRDGIPSEEILKVSDAENAELIIMGFNGKKGIRRLISGSVVKDVEKRAKVPVLSAKRQTMCEEPYTWRDAKTAASVFTVVFLGLLLLGFVAEKAFLH